MTSAPADSRSWSLRKWIGMTALVFAVQVGVIYWLGARTPDAPPAPEPGLTLILSRDMTDAVPGALDPTVFARPHPHGFSGPAWLALAPRSYRSPDWNEPPFLLPLPAESLGRAFRDFVRANLAADFSVVAKIQPELGSPELFQPVTPVTAPSTLEIEGALAARKLEQPMELPGWPHREILKPTVVRVAVNLDGRVSSAVVLSSSGLPAADDAALRLAGTARFESMRPRGPDSPARVDPEITWGKMIFHWQTLPLPPGESIPGIQ